MLMKMTLQEQFRLCFIVDDRYTWLLDGLKMTLLITLIATLVGIAIGIVIATIRSTYDKNLESLKKYGGAKYAIMRALNTLAQLYLTVIRGTPVVVQLMIWYFVVFATSNQDLMIASVAFGINSGAYVAEIFRSGIMAIDNGQFEAGRSMGFNYVQTMRYIIIPQMFKVVLPTLLNEFIALLKETSVAGYVGITDLTRAGDIIRGRTYIPFMPLLAVAAIYLLIVVVLSWLVKKLERRLRSNER